MPTSPAPSRFLASPTARTKPSLPKRMAAGRAPFGIRKIGKSGQRASWVMSSFGCGSKVQAINTGPARSRNRTQTNRLPLHPPRRRRPSGSQFQSHQRRSHPPQCPRQGRTTAPANRPARPLQFRPGFPRSRGKPTKRKFDDPGIITLQVRCSRLDAMLGHGLAQGRLLRRHRSGRKGDVTRRRPAPRRRLHPQSVASPLRRRRWNR